MMPRKKLTGQTIRKVAKDPFLKAMVACDGEALKRIIDGRGHGRKDEVGKGEDEGEWLVRVGSASLVLPAFVAGQIERPCLSDAL